MSRVKRTLRLFAALLLYAAVAPDQTSGPTWYSTGGSWTNRKPVIISHTQVSGSSSLTNFPMLFSVTDANLKTVANGGSVGIADGSDILFTAADGVTKLNHEIESYNANTGQIIAWVQIPSLSPAIDTTVYLYYGNGAATNQQNAAAVWDSHYNGVWHFPDGTNLSAADSTARGTNGTPQNSIAAGAGKIGGGASFNAATQDHITIPDGNLPQGNGSYTLEAWILPQLMSNSQATLFSWGSLGGTGDMVSAGITHDDLNGSAAAWVAHRGGDRHLTNSAQLNAWTHYVVTYDGTTETVTLNGGTFIESRIPGVLKVAPSGTAYIGKDLFAQGWWNGALDEVRISDTARTADWVATEYNNQSLPSVFFSVGPQQNPGSSHVSDPVFSPAGGTYRSPQTVSIATATTGASIRYTTDGSAPSGTAGTLYTGPITIGSPTRIRAIAYEAGMTSSSILSATYTIRVPAQQALSMPAGPSWYNASWINRKAITLYHTQVAGNLTNFPVLISLSSDANLAASAQASGNDILFTAFDGVTKLSHQIEQYTSSTGQLIAWVQVPALSSTTDTVIYVYYGNSSAGNQQNATGVWDSNYQGVWHFSNGAGLSGNDSTANGRNLTNFNVVAGSGEVGGGASFNGTNAYFNNSSLSIGQGSSITVSFWNFVTAANVQPAISFTIGYQDFPNRIMASAPYSDQVLYWDYGNNPGGRVSTSYSSYLGTWSHVQLVYDASTNSHLVYLNGNFAASLVNSNRPTAAETGIDIGRWSAYGGIYDKATMDEFRVSNLARSASWITTEYRNQHLPATFFSIGSQQSNLPLVASPTFSPAAGTYGSTQTVTIGTATSGASIRYTMDNSTPSESHGTLYTTPVTVSTTITIKAIAYAAGMTDSSVSSALFTVGSGGLALVVTNPGFESDVLALGTWTSDTFAAGWTCTINPGFGSGSCGAQHPGSGQWTGGVIPEGANTAYSNGGTISQTLPVTLANNTMYTLKVYVGKRLDSGWPGYSIQLLAGNTVIAQDNNSLNPAAGTFSLSTINYQSLASDPLAGLALTIKLIGNLGAQTNFDAVSLSAAVGSTGPWYSTGGTWTSRKPVTVDHTKVSGSTNLTNFPMLLSVTDAGLKTIANGGGVGKSDGTDILFTASDGVTKLNHEIETYNGATGQLIAWVQIPSLSPTADTAIYIYYGNASASNQQNATGVWDSNYKGVWHLTETSGQHKDSTSNANQSSAVSAGSQGSIPAPIIAGGDAFTASTDRITIPNSASIGSLATSNQQTVSGWVYGTGVWNRSIISSWSNTYYTDSLVISMYSDNKAQFTNDLNSYGVKSGSTVSTGAWHYVVAINDCSSNVLVVYLDGVAGPAGTCFGQYSGITSPVSLGGDGASHPLNGYLDEARISNNIRSAAWIATEYNNQNSPSTFLSVGQQQNSAGGSSQVATPAFSPAAGIYGSAQTVTISTTTSGASIRYTTDGSTPTPTTGTLYTSSITIPTTTTVKAIAYATGMIDSVGSSISYTITNPGTYRRQITIDHTKVSTVSGTTLYNFPVVFSGTYPWLATVSNGGKVQNANGYDIILTSDSAGANKLDFEIETYNATNGTVNFWARIPALSPIVDTVIYVFYGNSAVTTSQENKTGVWRSNFKGIWHLPNGTTLNTADTVTGVTAAVHGVAVTTGKIDGAANIGGGANYLDYGGATLAAADDSDKTVSLWLNPSASAALYGLVDKDFDNTGGVTGSRAYGGWGLWLNQGKARWWAAPSLDLNDTQTIPTNTWTHLAVTWSTLTGVANFYMNGSLSSQQNVIGLAGNEQFSGTQSLVVGARRGGTDNFPGSMDEVQVSNTVRSADWISTEFANQNNPTAFYSVGSEATSPFPLQVAAPVLSPGGGTYSPTVQVSMGTATPGASIYYTLDGSTPTSGSLPFTGGPITVSSTTTIKAIASAAGMTDSAIRGEKYTIGSGYSYYATQNLAPPVNLTYVGWVNQGIINQTYSQGGYGGVGNQSLPGSFLLWQPNPNAEVKLTVRTNHDYGVYSVYLCADSGLQNYYAVTLVLTTNPYLIVSRTTTSTGTVNLLSVPAGVVDGSKIRAIHRPDGHIIVYVDNILLADVMDGDLTSGSPGLGVPSGWSAGGPGTLLSEIDIGNLDTIPPNPIPLFSIGVSVLPNEIDLQWPPGSDDPQGTGVLRYQIWRNGVLINTTTGLSFFDTTVVPNQGYIYKLTVQDYHLNSASTTFGQPINTSGPFPMQIEGRRVGVRSTGAYWGAGGENIDVRSGNLSFTLPLLKAQSRGGRSVPFSLSYNSQNWRQDSAGTWQFGVDVGYGYGWKLLAGSITPVWSDPYTAAYYLFTDSSGAEYRLDQNNNNVWSSKESIYIYFDANLNRLYFRDGSYWDLGCISASTEADAGVMYPTLMQDTNGNQILIRYNTAQGAYWTNSSSRISQIEDVRAVSVACQNCILYATYQFSYNADPIPHLTSITNTITTGEAYTFTYAANQPLASPLNGQSFGTTTTLSTVVVTGQGATHSFTYNGSAELTQVNLPYGGYLKYDYLTTTYSSGRMYREVMRRYLSKDGTTASQTTYPFSHEPTPGPDVHQYTILDDPGGIGEKYWAFATTGASEGLVTQYQGRHLPGPATKTQNDYTWAQDAVGNNYIAAVLTTADLGQSYQKQSKTTQTVDIYGNVSQVQSYDYGSLTMPARTTTYSYLNASAYISAYILNRLTQATVTNGTNTVTLATNTYDEPPLTPPAVPNPTPREWDTSYPGARKLGNVTTAVTLSGTRKMTYDVTGNVATVTVNGVQSQVGTNGNTNYAVPTQLTTGSLTGTMSWSSFLGLTNETGPNGDSSGTTYDQYARKSTETSPFGAQTAYTYNNPPYSSATPATVKATITTPAPSSDGSGRWTRQTLDGLGRTIITETGDTNGTKSQAETVYDSCGCSPLGKIKQKALPHTVGGTQWWTSYTYDGIGRTLTAATVGRETQGTTNYVYQGNTVKSTDPAGNWKLFTMDAFGNLIQVTEPDPANPTTATYVTNYTYDLLNNLTGVSMQRPTGTQTRTFNYGTPPGAFLLSATNPENGTVTYTYNPYMKLASKTDAKGQYTSYSYDTLARLFRVQHYPNGQGTNEDTSQQVNYTYDYASNALPGALYVLGRLSSVSYQTGAGPITESYSYNPGGAKLTKLLQVTYPPYSSATYWTNLQANYTYDKEGRMTSVGLGSSYQWNWTQYQGSWSGSSYGYTYDSMGRPLKLTDQGASQDVITGTTYGPSGELLTMSGTVNETRVYNTLLQLTSVASGSVNLQYSYSATQNNGKIQSQTDVISGEQITYTYDSLLRLASATSNQAWNQSFSYDGFGNLTDVNGTSPMHLTFNPANNRPTGAVADANGNNTTVGSFDVENRLVTATGISYGYAPDNKRVWRYVPGSLNELTLWGVNGQKLATFNVGGTPQSLVGSPSTTNVWFGGRLALKNGSAVSVDNLGSRGKYYPYGGERGSSNPANGQEKFATYTRDAETGLDYADQRYYQPGTGMFLSPDPYRASGGAGDPGSWNRYAYTRGDPVNRFDPAGLVDDTPTFSVSGYCYGCRGIQLNFFGEGGGSAHPINEAYWDLAEETRKQKRQNKVLGWLGPGKDFLQSWTPSSQPCDTDLANLGLTPNTVENTAGSANLVDAATTSDMAPNGQSILEYMVANGADFATPLPAPNPPVIYYDVSNFSQGSFSGVVATLLHEVIHAATGFNDAAVASRLGIKLHFNDLGVPTDSYKISDRLQKDCFKDLKNP